MASKAVISLSTGQPAWKTPASLVKNISVGRPSLALDGVAQGVASEGRPSLPELTKRYEAPGGRYLVCPICFNAKHLDGAALAANASLGGTVPLWEWIGDEPATTFSY